MDGRVFDDLTRAASRGSSRRAVNQILGSLFAGGVFALAPEVSAARKKGGKNKKKKKNKDKKKECPGGCQGGTLCCDGVCVSVITDRNNCGACGNACAVDQICSNAACTPCDSPRALCTIAGQEQCVDLKTDRDNCGSCGNICPRDPSNPLRDLVCLDGQCKCSGVDCTNGRCCPAGFTVCVAGGAGCCPDRHHSCGNGRCCPDGFTCGGNCNNECCPA